MIYILVLFSILISVATLFAMYLILDYFSKKNKINTGVFFSFVVDKELKRIRIADLSSMKRIKKVFHWPSLEHGEWITYVEFLDHFSPECKNDIIHSLENQTNAIIPVKILDSKHKNNSKKMKLSLEIVLEDAEFMILNNRINIKDNYPRSSGANIKMLNKLLGKKTNGIVFYAMLLKDHKEKEIFIDKIYQVYPSFLQFFFGIYEYDSYIIFAFKKEEKKLFFDKEKKWNSILDNPKISNCFLSMAKIEQDDLKNKEKLVEFQSKIEYANYKTIVQNKVFFFKQNSQQDLAELVTFEGGREYFHKELNLTKMSLVKYPINRNNNPLKDFAYVGLTIEQFNSDIHKLALIPKYKIALNELYLKKTLLHPINKKIIDIQKENFKFVFEHKTLFIKNKSILNFNYSQENLDLINNNNKEGLYFSIEINKMDDEIFEKILNTNLFAIVIGENLSANLNNPSYILWLSYLKEIAISKKIRLFYKNPLMNIEQKIINQIGMEFWFKSTNA